MLDSLAILQVNDRDVGGGAATMATALHHAYCEQGQDAWMAVGNKLGSDPRTLPIRHDLASSWWQRPFWRAEAAVTHRRSPASRGLRYALLAAAEPRRVPAWLNGREDFYFPNTSHILDLPGSAVDILHLHNLHGRYFDLRQLPRLTGMAPTVLSLHDAWLFSGHCAHSLNCERWREGCGQCPDLSLYPAILRDATAENWQRKQEIYAGSRYHIISPCHWLADRIADSPLAAGLVSSRVIPHGVDLSRFHPGDRAGARRDLSLPENAQIVLMAANGMRSNPWKGFAAAQQAFSLLSAQDRRPPLLVLVLGDSSPEERDGNVTIRYVPFISDRASLAAYYQAADLFVSSSIAEVWGLTITEAMACGIPVVATAVGGVPEQVLSWPERTANGANGILVQPGDAPALADAVARLLDDTLLRQQLGSNAAQHAKETFDFNQQVARYLAYYREIAAAWHG